MDPTQSEELMEAVPALLASPTSMESALNVLPALSGAQPQADASLSAVKMQFSQQLPIPVSALPVSDS